MTCDGFAVEDDAEEVEVGEAARELAVGELVAHRHLVHGEREGPGESLHELAVLALVGVLEEVAPQRVGRGADLLVGALHDVHAVLDQAHAETFAAAALLPGVASSSETRW